MWIRWTQPGGVSAVDHERARTATPIASPHGPAAAGGADARRRLPRRPRSSLRAPIIVGAAASRSARAARAPAGLDGGVRAGVVAADLGRDRARRRRSTRTSATLDRSEVRRRRGPRRSRPSPTATSSQPRRSTGSGPTRRSCARSSRTRRRPPGRSPGASTSPPCSRPPGSGTPTSSRSPTPSPPATPPSPGSRRRPPCVRAARQAVVDRTEAVFTGAYERADAELDANPLASYRTVLGVRHLVDGGGVERPVRRAPPGSPRSRTAVATLRASHAEAEAERSRASGAGRDRGLRAIDLAGRDARLRLGLRGRRRHERRWYAGTAEFRPEDGGWGHITLSRQHRATAGATRTPGPSSCTRSATRRRSARRARRSSRDPSSNGDHEIVGHRLGDRHGLRPARRGHRGLRAPHRRADRRGRAVPAERRRRLTTGIAWPRTR